MRRVRDSISATAHKAVALLGLRGIAMLQLATLYVLIGYSVLSDAAPTPSGAFHVLIPPTLGVALWWGSAAIAAVTAWTIRDHIGIAALTFMPFVRALSFAGSWLVTVLPPPLVEALPGDPVEGSSSSWVGMAYSLIILGFVVTTAFIHDVRRPRRIEQPGDQL